MNIDIINMRFKYLDTDMLSDVEYLDFVTDKSKVL